MALPTTPVTTPQPADQGVALILTLDEYLCLPYLLMNVRDELYDLARRDENLQHYVRDVEYCLKVLRRPGVRQGLTNDETIGQVVPPSKERNTP